MWPCLPKWRAVADDVLYLVKHRCGVPKPRGDVSNAAANGGAAVEQPLLMLQAPVPACPRVNGPYPGDEPTDWVPPCDERVSAVRHGAIRAGAPVADDRELEQAFDRGGARFRYLKVASASEALASLCATLDELKRIDHRHGAMPGGAREVGARIAR